MPCRVETHNRVKFRQDDPVDTSLPLCPSDTRARKVLECPVEFGQLVNSLIADQGLADENDLIGIVYIDELYDFQLERAQIASLSQSPTLASARMSGSLSCIRPAVSIKTTSKPFALAKPTSATIPELGTSMNILAGRNDGLKVYRNAPYEMASLAIPAASFPYPLSYNSTRFFPSPTSMPISSPNAPRFLTCTRSCSTAPLLNVSQAAMRTRSLFWSSQKQTFERLVDLPTPFTPTKVIVYGSPGPSGEATDEGADLLRWISRRMSVDVLGVSTRVSEADKAD